MLQRAERAPGPLHVRPHLRLQPAPLTTPRALTHSKWFLEKTGHVGLNNLLAAYEVHAHPFVPTLAVMLTRLATGQDKTAYAQCIFAFSLGPGHEPQIFCGRCPVSSERTAGRRALAGVRGSVSSPRRARARKRSGPHRARARSQGLRLGPDLPAGRPRQDVSRHRARTRTPPFADTRSATPSCRRRSRTSSPIAAGYVATGQCMGRA